MIIRNSFDIIDTIILVFLYCRPAWNLLLYLVFDPSDDVKHVWWPLRNAQMHLDRQLLYLRGVVK